MNASIIMRMSASFKLLAIGDIKRGLVAWMDLDDNWPGRTWIVTGLDGPGW